MVWACRVLLLAAALSGCASDSPRSNLLTYSRLDALPTATTTGRLIQDVDCIFAEEAPGVRHLLIWPAGFRRDGDAIIDGSRPVATIGSVVTLGGGFYGTEHEEFLRGLIGRDIPRACATPQYFLVTAVNP